MPREEKKYPSVPLLPGEVQAIFEMVRERYVNVHVEVANAPYNARGNGINLILTVDGPKNLLRPLAECSIKEWGFGQYKSLEGALYAALWDILDKTALWDDMDLDS